MRPKQTTTGTGTTKVNLVILQMEGETAMLAKSIDSFVQAMTVKPTGAQPRIASALPMSALQPSTSESESSDEAPITPAPPLVEDLDVGPVRQRSSPRKLKLVPELHIAEGEAPFAEFCAGKDVKDWAAKIILAGTWMRDHRQRPEISADDIYTCLRHQWDSAPDDLPQMLRDMTRRELLEKGTTRGAFKLSIMSEKKLKKIELGT